jgi:hypothetical protein
MNYALSITARQPELNDIALLYYRIDTNPEKKFGPASQSEKLTRSLPVVPDKVRVVFKLGSTRALSFLVN